MSKKAVEALTSTSGMSNATTPPEKPVPIRWDHGRPDVSRLDAHGRKLLAKLYQHTYAFQEAGGANPRSKDRAQAKESEHKLCKVLKHLAKYYPLESRTKHADRDPKQASRHEWRQYTDRTMADARRAK
jgi:hypothetical protein